VAEKWKTRTAEQKAPFEEMKKLDVDRYKADLEIYAKTGKVPPLKDPEVDVDVDVDTDHIMADDEAQAEDGEAQAEEGEAQEAGADEEQEDAE
jgi:hypothetical protein